MRKRFLPLALSCLFSLVLAVRPQAQVYRFHGSLMYVMDETVYVVDNPNESGTVSTVKGGPAFGLGIEYRPSRSFGMEWMYIRQGTKVRDWPYPSGGGMKEADVKAGINHLLASPILYFDSKGRSTPFLGGMAGLAFSQFRNPDNGASDSRAAFAWGFRGGLDFSGTGIRGGRLFANLLWSMKGVGGNLHGGTATTREERHATMIQLQFGANLTLQMKTKAKKATVAVPVEKPVETVKPKSIEEMFLSRRNRLVREFTLSGDTLHLGFYDNAMVDRDSISLYLNGELRVRNLEVRSETKRFSFPIKDLNDTTDFVMVAENMGRIPPNTAMVRAGFDGTDQEVLMESTDTTSAMIRFVNPGGKPRRPVEPKPSVQEPTPEPLDRKVQMKAEMKRQAGDIRERIPEAEVFESEEDIRVLFSTLMMFKKNSFELSESHRRELAGFQKVFLEYPGTRLIIEGYTDDTGNEPLNLDLSRKRAEAVMSELLRLGTPAERMRASGLGQERPRYPNDSENNRRRNRRVELVIVRD